MPLALQSKLLRFLEERTFRRVGGSTEISVDIRVIAATNRDIEQAIEEKQFRSDLMFRLNVVPVFLPPLRERGEDIRQLSDHFVMRFSTEFKKPITRIEDAAYKKLFGYPWPGNVRELRNVLERAVLLSRNDSIGEEDIVLGRPDRQEQLHGGFVLPADGIDFHELENSLIRQALARTNNNQTQAAKLLSLTRDAFRYRLEKLGLL